MSILKPLVPHLRIGETYRPYIRLEEERVDDREHFDKAFLKSQKKHLKFIRRLKKILEEALSDLQLETPWHRLFAYLRVVSRMDSPHLSGNWEDKKRKRKEENSRLLELSIVHDFLLAYEEYHYNLSNWPLSYQKHFKFIFATICSWHDCFISYARDTYSSARYKEYLYDKLKSDHVVETIHYVLSQRKGIQRLWFDNKKLKGEEGRPLETTLKEACHKSLVLVQVLDEFSFNRKDKINWQYEEWKFTKDSIPTILSDHQCHWLKSTLDQRVIGVTIDERKRISRNHAYGEWWDYYFHETDSTLCINLSANSRDDFDETLHELSEAIKYKIDEIIYDLDL